MKLERGEELGTRLRGRLSQSSELVGRTYAYLFGRPSMQPVNRALFQLALRGQGYNNGSQLAGSGEERFIRKLARHDPAVCVDVGANRGAYSEALLRLTGTKVIAFEPLPKAFAALEEVGRRYPGRLTAVNAGVGDTNSVLTLHYGAEDSEHASFSDDVQEIDYVGAGNVNAMQVEVVTLDSYFEQAGRQAVPRIDLLKIDTEGYEYEVLLGAAVTIESYRPAFIHIEYNLHQLFRMHSLLSFSKLLSDYSPYQVLPHGSGLRKVDPKQAESNIYCYSNFVFARDGAL